MIRIVIGTDHHGVAIKNFLVTLKTIGAQEITWTDVGAHDTTRVDFPLYADKAIALMRENKADLGILLCGSGVGMSIAANRYCGIYAALAWRPEIAIHARQADNANVLVLPADYVSHDQALVIVQAWLSAEFAGGRYSDRLAMLDSRKECC